MTSNWNNEEPEAVQMGFIFQLGSVSDAGNSIQYRRLLPLAILTNNITQSLNATVRKCKWDRIDFEMNIFRKFDMCPQSRDFGEWMVQFPEYLDALISAQSSSPPIKRFEGRPLQVVLWQHQNGINICKEDETRWVSNFYQNNNK